MNNQLSNDEILYYSRQLILPQISIDSQLLLKQSKVLIVGLGGLGSSCAYYLCSCGVGLLGLLDFDSVELHNLHRQIAHNKNDIKSKKTRSCLNKLALLNPFIKFEEHDVLLDKHNALPIIEKYDIVVDCCDNVNTRYLVSDCCVVLNKILVSGSAVGIYGQLMVYNVLSEGNGPCYRCIYEKAPKREHVANCSEAGVIGAVTGVIGSMQAMETIKIITNKEKRKDYNKSNEMLIYDAIETKIEKIKMRNRQKEKCLCSLLRTKETKIEDIDYETFCNNNIKKENKVDILSHENRMSASDYSKVTNNKIELIDVRNEIETKICKLQNSINIPLNKINENVLQQLEQKIAQNECEKIIFYCRRGNDSQLAVEKALQFNNEIFKNRVFDIIGGLYAYKKECDKDFPVY